MCHVYIWLNSLLLCTVGFCQDSLDEQFVDQVLPVLEAKCFSCHGEQDHKKGELDATSLQGLLNGGESGEASIVVGDPDRSLLVQAIKWEGFEMPPKANDRLNSTQISAIEKWIRDGAVWPNQTVINKIRRSKWNDSDNADGERVFTSGGQSKEWTHRRYKAEDIWAIRPLFRPKSPDSGYSIDSFVSAKLESGKIEPAPPAKPRELIRRAMYDLIGLPPTPTEIRDFENVFKRDANRAWNDLIDRLLSSRHYGERWAQHWLDVVRYADTAGFSNDFELSNAWRYRDYVIRSFNNDLPYDQFVLQQLAGDELFREQRKSPNSRLSESEATVATGFLRMGPWEHTGMSPPKISRQNYVDDLVDNVGKTFLSTALRCCKCHDHKFDPIPTRDYYRVYAAFNTTQPAEIQAPFLDSENRNLFESQRQHCVDLLDYAKGKLAALRQKREKAAKQWYQENGIADQYQPWHVRSKPDFDGKKPPRNIGLTPQEEGRLKVREQDVRIWNRRLRRFSPVAQSVYNGPVKVQNSGHLIRPEKIDWSSKLEESFILGGGDVFSPQQKVTPGVLSCVGIATDAATEVDRFAITDGSENRRLQLARWIVNRENGLAVRSIVNRIWHFHFGKGIAANPNNFGSTGAKPTHPDLLDWLAIEFVQSGWSIKALHRRIMKSDTYMRSTQHPNFEYVSKIDPNNRLLAYFDVRRLTGEEVRDTMLAASAEINLEIGGLPIRPEINLDVALSPRMIQFSISPAYQPERSAKDRNRRSIYAYRVRGLRNPFLEVLDQPNLNESCENRDSASTTPQAFTMLNSDSVIKRSLAMASRLQNERKSIAEQIEFGFELVTGQILDEVLLQNMLKHYENMLDYHSKNSPSVVNYPTLVTRSLVEENTGETFSYDELLDIYQNYEADLNAADVTPEVRAMADICLIFFNSNQMMFVN